VKEIKMTSLLKRTLRVGIPVAVLALGATVYAQSRSNDCARPTLVARMMQATGFAGRLQPCALLQSVGDETVCLDPGKHCNVGQGSGKCQNVYDESVQALRCQCVPNH
jgi:hypothetical protein